MKKFALFSLALIMMGNGLLAMENDSEYDSEGLSESTSEEEISKSVLMNKFSLYPLEWNDEYDAEMLANLPNELPSNLEFFPNGIRPFHGRRMIMHGTMNTDEGFNHDEFVATERLFVVRTQEEFDACVVDLQKRIDAANKRKKLIQKFERFLGGSLEELGQKFKAQESSR